MHIFSEEKDRSGDTQEVAHRLADAIKRDRAKQQQFMGFLIQLAFIDGEVSKSEEEVLVTIAEAFEIDPQIYHAIFLYLFPLRKELGMKYSEEIEKKDDKKEENTGKDKDDGE